MVSVRRRIFHLYPGSPANHPNALWTPQASHHQWDEFLLPTYYYFGWKWLTRLHAHTVWSEIYDQPDTHCIIYNVYYIYVQFVHLSLQLVCTIIFIYFFSIYIYISFTPRLVVAAAIYRVKNFKPTILKKLPFVLTQIHMHYELLQHIYLYTHIYNVYLKLNDDTPISCIFSYKKKTRKRNFLIFQCTQRYPKTKKYTRTDCGPSEHTCAETVCVF